MNEGLSTALLWLGFAGTHVGLTVRPVRTRLVATLGEVGFIVLHSIVAIGTFAALTRYVALHRFAEAQASLLSGVPPVHGALLALSGFGLAFFVAGVLRYPALPMATFRHRVTTARGIQQISRHPFFSGLSIWGGAHAALASSPVTFVYFAGFVVLAFAGGLHQDRRLATELGEPYRAYLAATSFWPFVALATKRQTIAWGEQPWTAYALGIGASIVVYRMHGQIFDHGGGYLIAAVTVGSLVAMLSAWSRRERG
jgi:uncharacterized membrane protein